MAFPQNALTTRLESGAFFAVPGVQDPVAARLAVAAGFGVLFGSGYWVSAAGYGLPDAGLVTYHQMLDRMTVIRRATDAALIADADTGFGGLLNVDHTVRGYEAAGIAAIQIEDQQFPKKCGHSHGKRLVESDEMVAKLRVAVAARQNMLVIARTDARQSEGMEGVLRRLDAYASAGADILFPEALANLDELALVCRSFDQPIVANMANGGAMPLPCAGVLAQTGLAFALYPSLGSLAAAAAMRRAYAALHAHGTAEPHGLELFDFAEFGSLIGMDGVHAFEQKWAELDGASDATAAP